METSPSPKAGQRHRAHTSNQATYRYESKLGEQVAVVTMSDRSEFIVSRGTWQDYLLLGFNPRAHANTNGKGSSYPRVNASLPLPLPGWPTTKHSLARLLLAIAMVREERGGGFAAQAKGWTAHTLNGDPLDLRDCNLAARPAKGSRQTYNAVWSVRDRWMRIDRGLDPKGSVRARKSSPSRVNPQIKVCGKAPLPPSLVPGPDGVTREGVAHVE